MRLAQSALIRPLASRGRKPAKRQKIYRSPVFSNRWRTMCRLLCGLPVERSNWVWRTNITVRRENSSSDCFLIYFTPNAARHSAWPRTGGGSCLTLCGGNHGLAYPHSACTAHSNHPRGLHLHQGAECLHPPLWRTRNYDCWPRTAV